MGGDWLIPGYLPLPASTRGYPPPPLCPASSFRVWELFIFNNLCAEVPDYPRLPLYTLGRVVWDSPPFPEPYPPDAGCHSSPGGAEQGETPPLEFNLPCTRQEEHS